jgi:phosphatidylglycerophosphatase A
MHGSWGILLDDLVSGAYAALVLYAYRWLGPIA